MPARKALFAVGLTAISLPLIAGCRSGGIPLINYLGIGKPISVLIATDNPLLSASALFQYEKLRLAMEQDVGRTVNFELVFPILIEPHLAGGSRDVAILSPSQYADLKDPDAVSALAVPLDEAGRGARPALLIVAASAPIHSASELKSATIAFGPVENARTYHAGVRLLEQNGVSKSDLKRQLLPIPLSLRHLPDGASIARSVASGASQAGFIDLADWEKLPESGDSPKTPARDKFRVLGETVALPDQILVCSPKTPEAMRQKLREFFLAAAQRHPKAVMEVSPFGYGAISPHILEAIRTMLPYGEIDDPPDTGDEPGDPAAESAARRPFSPAFLPS